MDKVAVGALHVDVSAYDMPENGKIDKLVKALAVEDADTGAEETGYGVYAVSSGYDYGIMF